MCISDSREGEGQMVPEQRYALSGTVIKAAPEAGQGHIAYTLCVCVCTTKNTWKTRS